LRSLLVDVWRLTDFNPTCSRMRISVRNLAMTACAGIFLLLSSHVSQTRIDGCFETAPGFKEHRAPRATPNASLFTSAASAAERISPAPQGAEDGQSPDNILSAPSPRIKAPMGCFGAIVEVTYAQKKPAWKYSRPSRKAKFGGPGTYEGEPLAYSVFSSGIAAQEIDRVWLSATK